MITKQRLLVITMGATLACSCGVQAPPNDNAANGSAPAVLPAQTQANGAGPVISPTQGQPAPDQIASGQVDPPARVARLANTSGNVSFTPAGEHDWVQAQLNRPIVTGDKLWTADGARAELQIGSSTVRLDYQSNFDFLNLNDQIAQMQLTHGSTGPPSVCWRPAPLQDLRRSTRRQLRPHRRPTLATIASTSTRKADSRR